MRARSAMLPMLAVGLLLAAYCRAPRDIVVGAVARGPHAPAGWPPGGRSRGLGTQWRTRRRSRTRSPWSSTCATCRPRRRSTGSPSRAPARVRRALRADDGRRRRRPSPGCSSGSRSPQRRRVQSARNEIAIEFPDATAASAPAARREAPRRPPPATDAAAAAGRRDRARVGRQREGRRPRARPPARATAVLVPKTRGGSARPAAAARHRPARRVASKVPAVLPVGGTDLAKIRVATNSRTPLVTRVVLDLTRRMPYTVDRRAAANSSSTSARRRRRRRHRAARRGAAPRPRRRRPLRSAPAPVAVAAAARPRR